MPQVAPGLFSDRHPTEGWMKCKGVSNTLPATRLPWARIRTRRLCGEQRGLGPIGQLQGW